MDPTLLSQLNVIQEGCMNSLFLSYQPVKDKETLNSKPSTAAVVPQRP